MFVRPPTARTIRNTRRRPPSVRATAEEVSRPLLRQFVRNRRTDPRYEAYFLEVREGPAVNANTNAAAGKSMPQPWVTVRDYVKGQNSVGLPVSICNTLLKHLLTCVVVDDYRQTDSSEDSDIGCVSSPHPTTEHDASPTQVTGDNKSPGEEATSEDASVTKKDSSKMRPKMFQLSELKPIRIVCEATGCTLEVTARDPTAKRPSASSEEPTQTVQADPERRWLISAPLEIRTNVSSSGEQILDSSGIGSTTSGNGKRKNPWETRGTLELHGSLMAQLSAFLVGLSLQIGEDHSQVGFKLFILLLYSHVHCFDCSTYFIYQRDQLLYILFLFSILGFVDFSWQAFFQYSINVILFKWI
ncbi:unnamed protein product [Heterobilharzia americana]|nr:unnamed protein product [Heterobilharzia americana]